MDAWWLVMMGTFLVVWAYATLDEIALHLEEPFKGNSNLIPLSVRQYMLNERLIAIMNTRRPLSAADYVRNVLKRAAYKSKECQVKCQVC
jgi:predicted membrane chloride channel (bestrophin family)